MGRRGARSKTTNGDIESVAVAAADAEVEEDQEDQENQEEFAQNGDDPLAEVDDEDEDDKPLKKKSPKKRGAPANAKKKGKKAKKDKSTEEEDENDEAEPEEILPADEEPVYEVDKILDVQYLKSGAREFLIRWKNHGPESDTWEPEENLSCPDLIAKFTDKNTSPKGGKSSKKNQPKKKAVKSPAKPQKPADPDAEYEVEKIIEVHHRKDGTKEFLIRWKGCTSNEDTWEPEDNLSCPELISRFMDKVNKASEFEKREVRTAPKHTERFTLTMKSTGRRISKRNGNKQRATYYDAE